MNSAESAALKEDLARRGWREAEAACDARLVIINTCSVRETAEQRALSRIALYAARKRKEAGRFFLLVTGCMAARLGEKLRESGADFVLGPADRDGFSRILDELSEAAGESRTDGADFAESYYEEGSFRSFVPVTRGCDNFCSYCIVPYVRGRERSRPPSSILREIAFLAEKGVREITLLGQNVNSYYCGEEGATVDFPALLDRIACAVRGTPIRRVRFLSSHPKDFSERTIDALRENPVFCRHIHLCAQHGSNRLLAAMNRRYTREEYLALVRRLRAEIPDLSLSTDILIGFPGETDAEFEEALSLMEEVRFLSAYMYHYNPREGTAAARLDGRISEELKRARLARVIALQKTHTRALLRERGQR